MAVRLPGVFVRDWGWGGRVVVGFVGGVIPIQTKNGKKREVGERSMLGSGSWGEGVSND